MSLDINLFHHLVLDPVAAQKLDMILEKLNSIEGKVDAFMKTLDETLDEVRQVKSKAESFIVLFNGLKQQLADVLSGASLSPAVQAKVDAIFDEAAAAAGEVDAAIAANTPPPAP